jgi:transcriptional regulator with XRE-family HTH domain
MSRSLGTPRHKAVAELLASRRKAAGLTQATVASRLHRPQSFIATIERGHRRVDVVEFLELANAIGFEPGQALDIIRRVGKA